jgi:tetratricopeptide (TPR) repeat protein
LNRYHLIFIFTGFILTTILGISDETKPKIEVEDSKTIEISNLNKRANYLINTEEYDEALQYIKKSFLLDPNNQWTHQVSLILSIHLEKFDEAKTSVKIAHPWSAARQLSILAEECLRVSPSSKKIREQTIIWAKESQEISKKKDQWNTYLLASAYFRNNELEKAIEEITPLISQDPKNNNYNILLGNIHVKKGDYPLATTYLSKAIKKAPVAANIQNHIAYQLISYDDIADNRSAEALPMAIAASTASKQLIGDIEETLALAYFQNKEINKAIETQERAIKLLTEELPENQKTRSTKLLGFKKQLNKYKKAVKN